MKQGDAEVQVGSGKLIGNPAGFIKGVRRFGRFVERPENLSQLVPRNGLLFIAGYLAYGFLQESLGLYQFAGLPGIHRFAVFFLSGASTATGQYRQSDDGRTREKHNPVFLH